MTMNERSCNCLSILEGGLPDVTLVVRMLLAGFVVLTATGAASAGKNEIIARFRLEYPQASKHLEDVYDHSRISATQSHKKKDGSGFAVNQLEFMSNGQFSAISATYRDGVPAEYVGRETVFLISPDGAYTLTRFPRTTEFTITGTSSAREFTDTLRRDVLPAYGAFCINGERLSDLIAEPNFTVTNAIEVHDGQGVSYRLEWTNTINHPVDGKVHESGWFVVSPDESWALREYECSLGTDALPLVQSVHQTAEFGEKIDGAPIVKHVVLRKQRGDKREESLYKEYDTLRFSHEQIADNVFALAAYGIEVPRNMLYPWLVGLNVLIVLLLIGAVLLKMRAKRLREVRGNNN